MPHVVTTLRSRSVAGLLVNAFSSRLISAN